MYLQVRIAYIIQDGLKIKSELEALVAAKGGTAPPADLAELPLSPDIPLDELEEFGKSVGVLARKDKMGHDDAYALNELATAGLKGVSAYAAHAHQMGFTSWPRSTKFGPSSHRTKRTLMGCWPPVFVWAKSMPRLWPSSMLRMPNRLVSLNRRMSEQRR